MRLYHFLSARYALEDLRKRRLKISQIDDLNDPFELWSADQRNRQLRTEMRSWKKEMSGQCGMLCFCATWWNPLLWSHYADRHKGVCLGFDVRDDCLARVNYTEKRAPPQLPVTEDLMRPTLFTKFSGWSYEEEWRTWCALEERDPATNLYFREFDEDIKLVEVIVGPLCAVSKTELAEAARGCSPRPNILKARLAFRSFRVVKDRRGVTSSIRGAR